MGPKVTYHVTTKLCNDASTNLPRSYPIYYLWKDMFVLVGANPLTVTVTYYSGALTAAHFTRVSLHTFCDLTHFKKQLPSKSLLMMIAGERR